jgi:DNA-binding NtrC family response regulator
MGENERFILNMPQVFRSREMRHALDLIRRVVRKDLPVLLMGESGTGRRQLARLIHDLSPRNGEPFASLSCTGLAEGELRAELFGDGYRIGLVEAARYGTVYLEEVGDLTMEDQRLLMRLLRHEISNELRIICSTWHELYCEAVHDTTFHAMLFFSISRYPIPIPPLRRRKADIPALARTILAEVEPTRPLVLERETIERLMCYEFPGNLVELRSALIWSTLMADGESILPVHLPPKILA